MNTGNIVSRWFRTSVIASYVPVIGLWLAAAVLAEVAIWRSVPAGVHNIARSLAPSFIFAGFIALAPAVSTSSRKLRLTRFLGAEFMTGQVVFACPRFELRPHLATALPEDRASWYQPHGRRFTNIERRIDLPVALASHDVDALMLVSDLLPRAAGSIQIWDASRIEDLSRMSYIGIGLRSNECVFMYIRSSRTPLFSLLPENQPDYIELANGMQLSANSDRSWGLIVRHFPDEINPNRRWLLCSGLGASGTPAAAWYLRSRWRLIYNRVRRDSDFVVAVSCHPEVPYAPRVECVLSVQDDEIVDITESFQSGGSVRKW